MGEEPVVNIIKDLKDAKTIMIVDDEEPIVDILVHNLTKEGYKYRDIISWGFFSEEVQKRDKEFYSEIAKNK